MLLRQLLEETRHELLAGSMDMEITSLVYDSRKVTKGALFVCIKGTKLDSHDFMEKAAQAGAAAIAIEQDRPIPEGVTVIKFNDTRLALALMSAAWFGHPARRMRTIGITGTKGKTTTSFMIKKILEEAGHKVGVIGTNGVTIGAEHFDTSNTTPESYELNEYFAKMADAGCGYMVMEVSSQGIMMKRVGGLEFDVGLFTNISPDHIGEGEHATFEEYRHYKGLLFQMCRTGIGNADDPNWDELCKGHTCELKTYGMKGHEDYLATDVEHLHEGAFMGVSFNLKSAHGAFRVKVAIPGFFSVYNALGAAAVALELGVGSGAVISALSKIRVKGRMETIYASKALTVIVDYAHNGVAAKNMLETLRAYNPKRLVVVFGCGGNRDPHRRYEMGREAGKLADLSIVTADNSRFEAVEDIMKDIHIGLDPTGGKYVDISDRREAINYAIRNSQDGDVVAIIGKGHEDYQEIRGKKTHFSDAEEAKKALAAAGYIQEG